MKFGKWIGGGLGWVVFGPIGALLGFALGAAIDSINVQKVLPVRTTQNDFVISLLVLTAAIMKADGKVLKAELDFVKRFYLNQFGEVEARQYLGLLKDILEQDIPVAEVSMQIRQHMDYSARLQLLHYLFGIARADGEVHPTEITMIRDIAGHLGIGPADLQSIHSMFGSSTSDAYKILEITPAATDEEVKKAYRRMAMKYHPDKVAGLGNEVQRAAKEKFQRLNTAYEEIKRQRNMK